MRVVLDGVSGTWEDGNLLPIDAICSYTGEYWNRGPKRMVGQDQNKEPILGHLSKCNWTWKVSQIIKLKRQRQILLLNEDLGRGACNDSWVICGRLRGLFLSTCHSCFENSRIFESDGQRKNFCVLAFLVILQYPQPNLCSFLHYNQTYTTFT